MTARTAPAASASTSIVSVPVWLIAAAFTGLAGAVNYLQALRGSAGERAQRLSVDGADHRDGRGRRTRFQIEGLILGAVVHYMLRDYSTDADSAVHVTNEVYLLGRVWSPSCAPCTSAGHLGELTRMFPRLQLLPVRRRLERSPTSGGDTDGP